MYNVNCEKGNCFLWLFSSCHWICITAMVSANHATDNQLHNSAVQALIAPTEYVPQDRDGFWNQWGHHCNCSSPCTAKMVSANHAADIQLHAQQCRHSLLASTECVPQNRNSFWHQAKASQRWFLQITMPTTNCQLIWNPMSIFFNIDAVHVIKENCPPSLTARAQCIAKMVSANHGADNKLGPLLHTATIRTSKCKENTKFLFTARANCALILWGSLPKK